jgi:hypothetical protein
MPGVLTRIRRLARRLLLVAAATTGILLRAAVPASAHTAGSGASPSDYRSTLVSITPRLPGVSVAESEGLYLRLTNTGRVPVTVFGYSGEPYLRVSRAGVWENHRSPATYLNRTRLPGPIPPAADAHATPVWRKISDADTARWHDHRLHWMNYHPPPAVQANPHRYHLIAAWRVTAVQAGAPIVITGTLAWVPGPAPWPWLALLAVAAGAVTVTGLLRRWWGGALAVALGVLLAADATTAGLLVAGRSGGPWERMSALPGHGVLTALVWAAVLASIVGCARGRLAGAYGAAFTGLCIALLSGIGSLAVLWRSTAITAGGLDALRATVALVTGTGTGALLAGSLVIRRLERPASQDAAAPSRPETPVRDDGGSLSGRRPVTAVSRTGYGSPAAASDCPT